MEAENQPMPVNTNNGSGKSGKVKMILVSLVLLAAGFAGGYFYRDNKAKDDAKVAAASIAQLQIEKAALQKQIDDAKAAADAAAKTKAVTSVTPSAATLANIKAGVTSGNMAALESYMAPTVTVIIAASGGIMSHTPSQAVADLAYLDKGTDPWNFALTASTLSTYRAGTYKKYFPTTAYVGKSANNYVVSFQFDANSKINGIFMAAPGTL